MKDDMGYKRTSLFFNVPQLTLERRVKEACFYVSNKKKKLKLRWQHLHKSKKLCCRIHQEKKKIIYTNNIQFEKVGLSMSTENL